MIAVAAAAFAGAVVQSATGLGFALVAGPVAFAVLGPEPAVLLLALLGLLVNALVLAEGERVAWDRLRPVLWVAPVGAIAGVLVLRSLRAEALQAGVGLAVLAALALHVRGRPLRAPAPAMGLVTGMLTTSVGINGPPLALWLAGHGITGPGLRATLAAAFGALALIGLAALAPGATEWPAAGTVALCAGAVLAGQRLGRHGFARLEAVQHERLVLAVIGATAVAAVAAGVLG